MNKGIFDDLMLKGDIFSSLANVFLVANVNKNDHAHSSPSKIQPDSFFHPKTLTGSRVMQFSYSTELLDDLFDQQNEIRSKEKTQKKMLTLDSVLVRCLTRFYGMAFIVVALTCCLSSLRSYF